MLGGDILKMKIDMVCFPGMKSQAYLKRPVWA